MLKLLNYIFIKVIPFIPKFLIKIFANQYVAGISIDDAIKKISKLNNKGLHATLDILGEHTQNDTEAINITNQYCKILEEIHAKNLNCNKNEIVSMSHPCGSYNDDSLKVLEKLGVELGFKNIMDVKDNIDKSDNSKFEIAREDHANIIKLMNQ